LEDAGDRSRPEGPELPGTIASGFRALGTGVRIATTSVRTEAAARQAVEQEVAAIDAACSRFREDSELTCLNRSPDRWVPVSPLLLEALRTAMRVARMTDGAVDPTVGCALRALGYDRDFAEVEAVGLRVTLDTEPAAGWQAIVLDSLTSQVRIPSGLELDLGSTAKALASDRAARAALLAAGGGGVLVSLGGDIAMAGIPPEGGWPVLVTDDHAAPPDAPGQLVHLNHGGLATSSTTVRRWARAGVVLHHILDPRTGLPAREHWRTVSVGAATCVDANAAATAAIVWGEPAVEWLQRHHLPAHLVRTDGTVATTAGWPGREAT
jgi:thiamine biosynthesis lipoprotein ApbE